MQADAFTMQADAFTMQADAFTMQADTLTMQADAFTMQADAFTMQANALALQGIAKFNSLRINEMLYLYQVQIISYNSRVCAKTQKPFSPCSQLRVSLRS